MKRFLICSLVGAMGCAGLTGSSARGAERPDVASSAITQAATVPQYVFAYNLSSLRQAVLIAESQGFVPIGPPQFRFVPELGGPGWVQFIAPAGY